MKFSRVVSSAFLLLTLALALAIFLPAPASDLSRGTAPQDGQVLHAADLDNLIDLTSISSAFVTAKPLASTLYPSDLLPLYSVTLGEYEKLQLSVLAPFVLSAAASNGITATTLTSTDLFSIYSWGTNSANPAATTTNPVTVVTTLTSLKVDLQQMSNGAPFLFPATSANTAQPPYTNVPPSNIGGNGYTNYWGSPIKIGNYNPASNPYGGTTWLTNGSARAMVQVFFHLVMASGTTASTVSLLYTNLSQGIAQNLGSYAQLSTTIGGTVAGTGTFMLNPGEIYGLLATAVNYTGADAIDVDAAYQYNE